MHATYSPFALSMFLVQVVKLVQCSDRQLNGYLFLCLQIHQSRLMQSASFTPHHRFVHTEVQWLLYQLLAAFSVEKLGILLNRSTPFSHYTFPDVGYCSVLFCLLRVHLYTRLYFPSLAALPASSSSFLPALGKIVVSFLRNYFQWIFCFYMDWVVRIPLRDKQYTLTKDIFPMVKSHLIFHRQWLEWQWSTLKNGHLHSL